MKRKIFFVILVQSFKHFSTPRPNFQDFFLQGKKTPRSGVVTKKIHKLIFVFFNQK